MYMYIYIYMYIYVYICVYIYIYIYISSYAKHDVSEIIARTSNFQLNFGICRLQYENS